MRMIVVSGLVAGILVSGSAVLAQTAGPSVAPAGVTVPAAPAMAPMLPEPAKGPASKLEAPRVETPKVDTPNVAGPKTGIAASEAIAVGGTGAAASRSSQVVSATQKPKAKAVVKQASVKSAAVKCVSVKPASAKHVAKAGSHTGHAKHVTTVKHHPGTGHPATVKTARHIVKGAAPAKTPAATTQPVVPRV